MRSIILAATVAVAAMSPVLATSAAAATRAANGPVVVTAQADSGAAVLVQTAARVGNNRR